MVDILLKIIYTEFLKQRIAVVFCFIKPVLINWVRKIRKKVFWSFNMPHIIDDAPVFVLQNSIFINTITIQNSLIPKLIFFV